MSSHMGTNFLHSCIKVPIDPCNNCPAPGYNRPKVFLSQSSTPSNKFVTTKKISDCYLDLDTLNAANGMRSLATFYDSIPDYCEINHLPENEFYSTLETIKTTYRQFKSKPSVPVCLRNESSVSLNYEIPKSAKIKSASSKCIKKKTTSRKNSAKKDNRNLSNSQCKSSYKDLCERMNIFEYKRCDIDDDKLSKVCVTPIKSNSPVLYKSLSMHQLVKDDIQPGILDSVKTTRTNEDTSVKRRPSTPGIREFLKKSFSFNDINTKRWQERSKTEGDIILSRSPESNGDVVPKINLQPPSPTKLNDAHKVESSKQSTPSTRKNKSGKPKTGSPKVPFSFLGINECTTSGKASSVSPIHPVARPNLAATLRLEVSKKKVKELQNNCTYNDHRSQIDWEVRKTPAWKSLSHNESHKEILAMRLATRKAEQELQKREYEIQMEIMRQRVKSAPLLLEGPTFWGPHVGKLSHSCHKDSLKHTCQQATNGNKKKKTNKIHSRKCHSNISYSRNSNHSTNLQDSDELSSLDRAYL
ncbi:uncharacterized protein LOC129913421 [Episyrphus balteatus]|uniref:uncharacterized protein LOC129913421 n=1 Tax=Episyrphus balteatus TaxID=286459 RepID=UPI002485858F|nr:uncharacterized protein LOC129913421 [Episyrphus balteatus]